MGVEAVEVFYDLEELFEPLVKEVNAMAEAENEENPEYIRATDIYMPLLERMVIDSEYKTLAEWLPEFNPYLAIELGLITKRQALLNGQIKLRKQDVLDGYILYRELPRNIVEEFDFTVDERKQLGVK